MQLPVPHIVWTISLSGILLTSAILAAAFSLVRYLRALGAPIKEFIDEHNVLWEDYNHRTGGSYRRRIGRGAPPDPEEWYREHPVAAEAKTELRREP